MPNLNNLYRTVFETRVQSYDPEKNYYTILMTTNEPFDRFYELVEQNLKLRMCEDSFSIIPIEKENEKAAKNAMRDIYDTLSDKYYRPPINYIYVSYANGDSSEIEKLSQNIEWARDIKRANDNIFIILLLKAGQNGKETVRNMPESIFADNEVFFFTVAEDATEIRKQVIISSVSGAIILNSVQDQYRDHTRRKSASMAVADQYKESLSDSALQQFDFSESKTWSSLHCKFFDRKMDFLAWYCYNMCDHLKHLDDNVLFAAFDSLYADHVKGKYQEKDVRPGILIKSITMTPMVEPPKKRKMDTFTLVSLFDELFGNGGEKLVELSLRTTLAGLYKESNNATIAVCAEKLYEECKKYNAPNLHTNIQSALRKYIERKTMELDDCAKLLKKELYDSVHDGGESLDMACNRYVNRYIARYDAHNEIQFWTELLDYVSMIRPEIRQILDENQANLDKINKFRTDCKEKMANFEQDSHGFFEEYMLSDFLDIIEGNRSGEVIFKKIRNIYDQCRGNSNVQIYNRLDDIFELDLISNIYRDAMIDFEHGTCVVRGYERSGKYLIFEN